MAALGSRSLATAHLYSVRRRGLWSIGLERFPLLGVSQGGAVAVAYAARHPDRVTKLVLCSSYARGRGTRAAGSFISRRIQTFTVARVRRSVEAP